MGRLGFVHYDLELGVAIEGVRITRTLICFQEKIQKFGVGENPFVQGDGGLDKRFSDLVGKDQRVVYRGLP